MALVDRNTGWCCCTLTDVGSALGKLSQSYAITGIQSTSGGGTVKARTFGTVYSDLADECDSPTSLALVCAGSDAGEP